MCEASAMARWASSLSPATEPCQVAYKNASVYMMCTHCRLRYLGPLASAPAVCTRALGNKHGRDSVHCGT